MDRLGHPLLGGPPRRRLTRIADSTRLRRRSLLAAAASASLAACGSARPSRSPVVHGADRLASALTAGDRASFIGAFAPTTSAQALAGRLWDNFLALKVTDPTAPSVGRLRVRWSAPGERAAAEEEVALTLADQLIVDVAATGASSPLWLIQPVTLSSSRAAACVAAPGTPRAEEWLRAAGDAAVIVGKADLGRAAAAWDGVLVTELPLDATAFARAAGLPAATAFATQAVTVLATAASAPRIVANPAATASLDLVRLRTLLVHEGVHAATRSAVSSAPLWAVEGMAESVAAASDEATRTRNLALVRASARPTALPADADLNGAAADTAYACASLAVDAAVARWGRPAFTDWLADWTTPSRPGDAALTAAYLAALP